MYSEPLYRKESFPTTDGKAVVICGSRGFLDGSLFADKQRVAEVDAILQEFGVEPGVVISGGARGADTAGEAWALANDAPIAIFDPTIEGTLSEENIHDTDGDGIDPGAYLRRNDEMVAHADALVAIWDGNSRGTHHSIQSAQEELGDENVHVWVYR